MSRKNRRKPGWQAAPAQLAPRGLRATADVTTLAPDQVFTPVELDFFRRGDEIAIARPDGDGAVDSVSWSLG